MFIDKEFTISKRSGTFTLPALPDSGPLFSLLLGLSKSSAPSFPLSLNLLRSLTFFFHSHSKSRAKKLVFEFDRQHFFYTKRRESGHFLPSWNFWNWTHQQSMGQVEVSVSIPVVLGR